MDKTTPIYIAGHRGMVGSAVVRKLTEQGYTNLQYYTSSEVNLLSQELIKAIFGSQKPKVVILAAATVGGIMANHTRRGDFISNNLSIQSNVIEAARQAEVEKLIFLGSSCIYPRETEQPIKEEALLTGPLEPTNEPYAIAKIAGIKLCESLYHQYGNNFYSLMPCNLYGINDNFDLETSHVLPALIRKVHEAKINKEEEVEIWGSGKPLREFLLVDDLAEVIEKCIQSINAQDIYEQGISQLNVGVGKDITIKKLTEEIMHTVGFKGKLSLDKTKPDGMMRKVMDVSRLEKLNLHNPTSLKDGLKQTYEWYKEKGCQNLKT